MNELTILCKVVDNFGDAGVVLRLARAMCALNASLHLRIITDNRKLFDMLQGENHSASSSCSTSEDAMHINNRVRFFAWDDSDGKCVREFSENPPDVILECFACGRPDWLEHLLFDGRATTARITHIVNVEFLTAEDYADEFHLMKSGTRSPHVKKSIFMPGFTQKTGGLILDGIFSEAEKTKTLPKHNLQLRKRVSQNVFHVNDETCRTFNVLVFTYDQKISSLVSALSRFNNFFAENTTQLEEYVSLELDVHLARGAGFDPFVGAWKIVGEPFSVGELPFLPQTEWDEMLCCCDFLFVRGEDSLSRACLSGVPFVWQAYRQDDDYQLVKVNALLERMKPYFSEEDFVIVVNVWQAFNVSVDTPASEAVASCKKIASSEVTSVIEYTAGDLIFELLKKSAERESSLVKSFEAFAKSLYENGNAANHLLGYIQTLC